MGKILRSETQHKLTLRNLFSLTLLLLFLSCTNSKKEQKVGGDSSSSAEDFTSVQWVTYKGNPKFKNNKKIVLVSGDEEYRSEEALPQLGKILATHHGFDCTVLFAQDTLKPGVVNPSYSFNIPGLESLNEADLMILFTRFRDLPDEQMEHLNNFLLEGKPIIGIRTSTHAFSVAENKKWSHWGNYYIGEKKEWNRGFGKYILGADWVAHHGAHKKQSTRGKLAAGAEEHPIIESINASLIWGASDVYAQELPMSDEIKILIEGQVINAAGAFDENDLHYGMRPTDTELATSNPNSDKKYNPNDPLMPIVWEKKYQIMNGKKGNSITSTIGTSTDILNEELRRFFVNASYYLVGLPIPSNSEVGIVGEYLPTQYEFRSDEYWGKRNMKVVDFQ